MDTTLYLDNSINIVNNIIEIKDIVDHTMIVSKAIGIQINQQYLFLSRYRLMEKLIILDTGKPLLNSKFSITDEYFKYYGCWIIDVQFNNLTRLNNQKINLKIKFNGKTMLVGRYPNSC